MWIKRKMLLVKQCGRISFLNTCMLQHILPVLHGGHGNNPGTFGPELRFNEIIINFQNSWMLSNISQLFLCDWESCNSQRKCGKSWSIHPPLHPHPTTKKERKTTTFSKWKHVYHTRLAHTLQESCRCGQELRQVTQCSFVCGSCDYSRQFLEIHQVDVG